MLTSVSSSRLPARLSVVDLAAVDSTRAPRGPSSSTSSPVARALTMDSFTPAPGRARAGVPSLPEHALAGLGAADRQTLRDISLGRQGAQARDHLSALLALPSFQRESPEVQAKALWCVVHGPPADAKASQQLLATLDNGHYQGLAMDDRKRVLDIFRYGNGPARSQLQHLLNRQLHGQSAALDTDRQGVSLLGRVHRVATQPLSPAFEKSGITRAGLLASLMHEASQPGQVNQSARGTCTVTSMQYMLTSQQPAEYARIIEGLVSSSGQVRLANGDLLQREADSIAPDTAVMRSHTERLFQVAMMEYGNGSDDYSNLRDESTSSNGVPYGGLYADQEQRALEALFGQKLELYQHDAIDPRTTPPEKILEALKQRSGQQTQVAVQWGSLGPHAVVAEKVENDRVYFRNPWGPSVDPAGTSYTTPPRRMEDPSVGLESMSVEDFKNLVAHVFIPQVDAPRSASPGV